MKTYKVVADDGTETTFANGVSLEEATAKASDLTEFYADTKYAQKWHVVEIE